MRREFSFSGCGPLLAVLMLFQTLSVVYSAPGMAAESDQVGVVNTAVLDVFGRNGHKRVNSGDSVFYEEEVRTGAASALEIDLLDESVLSIGENASLVLDSMVYQVNRGVVEGTFTLVSGMIHFNSAGVPMEFVINTPVASIGIRGTAFDVLADDSNTEVVVQSGTVDVTSPAGTQAVGAGQAYSIDAAGNTTLDNTPSTELTEAKTVMLATLAGEDVQQQQQTAATTEGETEAAVQQATTENPDVALEDLLALELTSGLVLIQTLPDLAPNHVACVIELARAGAYAGETFDFVRPGYAAETGQQTILRSDADISPLVAEVSDTTFERGTVGMSHPEGEPDNAIGAFFITLGDAPDLNQAYTVWGRVVYGIENLDVLAPGRPPATPDAIQRMLPVVDILGE